VQPRVPIQRSVDSRAVSLAGGTLDVGGETIYGLEAIVRVDPADGTCSTSSLGWVPGPETPSPQGCSTREYE
jgi:hypothetical protein